MKKISKLVILSLLLITTMLTGCSTINTDAPQYKIYELAKENGYTASYEVWNQEFNNGSLEFRLVNEDLDWKYVEKDEWLNLYEATTDKPTWYKELVDGNLNHTLEQFYSVSFITNNEDSVTTQILKENTKATKPADLTKEGYIFNGWYNGDTSFNFDSTINQKTVLTANWLIDGIHLDGFKFDNGYYTLEVNNDIEEVEVEDYIKTDSDWILSTTSSESGAITSKIATLNEGVNTFYLISIGTENKVYEIRIKRLEMFNVTFNFVYSNKDLTNTVIEQYQENSLLSRENYSVDGYTYVVDFDYSTKITEDTTVVITYTPKEYTITFDVNGGILEDNKLVVDFEDTIELPIPTKNRHKFLGWLLDGVEVDNNYEYTLAKDIKLVASWKQNEFFIDYELDGALQNSNNPTGYDENNEQLELFDIEKTGYTFLGWFTNSSMTTQITFIPENSSEDFKLYAKFEANTYKIEFISDGSLVNDLTVTYDKEYKLPVSEKDGYVFAGWYIEEVRFISGTWTIDGNITVTAKFVQYDYTIEFIIPDNASNETNQYGFNNGDTFDFNNPNNLVGYTFLGWYTDLEFTNSITGVTGKDSNLTVYGKFEANTYNVTLDIDGKQEVVQIEFDSQFNVKNPSKNGFKFLGWEYNDKFYTNDIWNIASDVTLVAVFEAYDNLLIFDCETENNLDNQTGYDNGEEVILLDPKDKEGYRFDGWYLNEEKIEKITPDMTGDLTLVAKFIAEEYTITFDVDGGNDMEPLSVTFDSEFTLEDATRDGFEFSAWTLDGTNVEDGIWSISSDTTLVAKWTIVTYKITYKLNDADNNEENLLTYTWEDEVILLDPSRQFDTFIGWYLGEELITTIPMNSFGDKTLEARFTAHIFQITYELNNGTISSNNVTEFSYDDGEIELITPTDGVNKFAYWCFDEYLRNKVTYLNHDLIKTLFDNEMINLTLYAKYTNVKTERQLFTEEDHRGISRTYVYFGSYPQKIVTHGATINALDNMTEVNEKGYYYYEGKEYAKQLVTGFNSNLYTDNTTKVVNGEYAYFEVDYIKWRVLQNEDKTLYLLSEYVLDISSFYNSIEDINDDLVISPNNFTYSDLRNFLNNNFYEQAFDIRQTEFMNTITELNDFVSSLSNEDARLDEYGFKVDDYDTSRETICTDYSIARGVSNNNQYTNKTASWWLSTGSETTFNKALYSSLSNSIEETFCNNGNVGIRPTISITL